MFFMIYPIFIFKCFDKSFSDFNNNLEFYIMLFILFLCHIIWLIETIGKLLESLLKIIHLLFLKSTAISEIIFLYYAINLCLEMIELVYTNFCVDFIPIHSIEIFLTYHISFLLFYPLFESLDILFEKFILNFCQI